MSEENTSISMNTPFSLKLSFSNCEWQKIHGYIFIIYFILGFFLNAALLYKYVRKKMLRIPINAFLLALVSNNLVIIFIYLPIMIPIYFTCG